MARHRRPKSLALWRLRYLIEHTLPIGPYKLKLIPPGRVLYRVSVDPPPELRYPWSPDGQARIVEVRLEQYAYRDPQYPERAWYYWLGYLEETWTVYVSGLVLQPLPLWKYEPIDLYPKLKEVLSR